MLGGLVCMMELVYILGWVCRWVLVVGVVVVVCR